MDLIPDNGPITGDTLLDIHGIDFINTDDVVVSVQTYASVLGIMMNTRNTNIDGVVYDTKRPDLKMRYDVIPNTKRVRPGLDKRRWSCPTKNRCLL